jgi:hypothetical protein
MKRKIISILVALVSTFSFAQEKSPLDWQVTSCQIKEEGIRMDMVSKEIQASAGLILYSNAQIDKIKNDFLSALQQEKNNKTTNFIGVTTVHKWEGYKYISASDTAVLAHLTVIIPCDTKRVLLVDMAVPVGSLNAKVNWQKMTASWLKNYNTWAVMLSQRR